MISNPIEKKRHNNGHKSNQNKQLKLNQVFSDFAVNRIEQLTKNNTYNDDSTIAKENTTEYDKVLYMDVYRAFINAYSSLSIFFKSKFSCNQFIGLYMMRKISNSYKMYTLRIVYCKLH